MDQREQYPKWRFHLRTRVGYVIDDLRNRKLPMRIAGQFLDALELPFARQCAILLPYRDQ